MQRITTLIGLGFAVAICLFVYLALDAILSAIAIVAQFVAAVSLAALIYLAILYWQRESHRRYRIIDGSLPMQHHKLPTGDYIIVDPNKLASAAYIVGPSVGYREIASSVGAEIQLLIDQAVQQTRSLAAIAPGDEAQVRTRGAIDQPRINVGTITKLLPKPTKLDPPIPSSRPPFTPSPLHPPLTLTDALAQSTGHRWIVGQADDGNTVAFEPSRHFSLGIIGATGTGKTTSVAFSIVLAALRAGWHVVVLNPDGHRPPPNGGAGWHLFQSAVELHETDPSLLPGQVETIYAFYQRRASLTNPRPVLVVCEEYGDTIRHLRKRSKSDAEQVDLMLDSLLQRGRKHNVHMAFVDQYPEHWSNAVLGGTKFKAVFQLGPGQGAKVEEYKANQLADVGRFLVRGTEYNSFDASARVPALLRRLPTPDKPRRIINGSATHVPAEGVQPSPDRSLDPSFAPSLDRSLSVLQEVAPPTPTPPNAPAERSEETRQAIFAYLDANPKATQADVRRVLGTSNGYTHECWHAWHNARSPVHPFTRSPVHPFTPSPAIPDALHGQRTLIDADDPTQAAEMDAIRQAVAAGKITIG